MDKTRALAGLASFGRVTAAVALSAEAVTRGIEQATNTAATQNIDYSDWKSVGLLLIGPAVITAINYFRTGETRFGRTRNPGDEEPGEDPTEIVDDVDIDDPGPIAEPNQDD